jgi:small subunit ribosomal protein S6
LVHDYEMIYILTPELDEAGLDAANQRVRGMLETRNAEVTSLDVWGRRRMAYAIARQRDGYYVLARFKMTADQADGLERALRLNENVLRHLLIRLDN